jgi:hypothetical protein
MQKWVKCCLSDKDVEPMFILVWLAGSDFFLFLIKFFYLKQYSGFIL